MFKHILNNPRGTCRLPRYLTASQSYQRVYSFCAPMSRWLLRPLSLSFFIRRRYFVSWLHILGRLCHCIAPRIFKPKVLPVDLVGPCIPSQPLIISPSENSLTHTPLWYKNGDRGKSGAWVRHQRLSYTCCLNSQVTDVRRILQSYAGSVSGDNY